MTEPAARPAAPASVLVSVERAPSRTCASTARRSTSSMSRRTARSRPRSARVAAPECASSCSPRRRPRVLAPASPSRSTPASGSGHARGVPRRLPRAWSSSPAPVLAAVRGAALGGGCELVAFCDAVARRGVGHVRPARDPARLLPAGRRDRAARGGRPHARREPDPGGESIGARPRARDRARHRGRRGRHARRRAARVRRALRAAQRRRAGAGPRGDGPRPARSSPRWPRPRSATWAD